MHLFTYVPPSKEALYRAHKAFYWIGKKASRGVNFTLGE